MSYLDTRDLQGRLEELDCALDDPDGLDSDEQAEHAELTSLSQEISEWHHGETMIPEDEFAEYAEELAKETSVIPEEAFNRWPYTCIDWDDAADQLKQDYTEVKYQGTTYLVRA
jgi:hypothetical protein